MQEIILKVRYFDRGLSKSLRKGNFIFSFEPSPFQQTKLLRKGPGTCDQSLLRLQNKFRKVLLLVMYYLTEFDDIISRGFLVILKITSGNLCKQIYGIINYSTCICPFESGQCGKEGKTYKNMNVSRTKRASKMK